jgi:uncharacterized protein YkwD
LRKLGAVVLALPVLAAFYLASVVQRGTRLRIASTIATAAVIALVVAVSQPPAPSAAVPVSAPRPVSASLLDAVRTGHALAKPFEIRFDATMDPASVAGAFRVAPDAAVRLSWDESGRVLTVAPAGHWQADTLYAVTVDASARSAAGGSLASPVRAVILTAPAGRGSIAAVRETGGKARLDTSFRIQLDRPLEVDAVKSALRSEPALRGELVQDGAPGAYLFTPYVPLDPETSYRVWLGGLVDPDGVLFADAPSLKVMTVGAPSVVRFRPFDGTRKVDRGATLSVRFTERMNRTSTAAAFVVTADGKPVKGTVRWAEHNEVLLFTPSSALAYGATIRMTVADTARSRSGVALDKAASGTFTVAPKPKPKPQPRPAPRSSPKSQPIPRSGGGGAVSGSWHSVELYYLKLMNCTRTGGWVSSSGSCTSPGGRNVASLSLSSGISTHVSRPYAKLLATRNLCDHFINGTPGDRLRRAGYTSYRWAENIGCRSGGPYSAVLGSHLFFQSEKSYNGGHYVNLMNAAYDRVGIGVWVSSGRVRLVVDFYHP